MMQTHLYLYLHDAQRLEWLLVNHGERLGTESGSWSDLEAHLSNEGVVQPLTTVILAGYQSSYVKTDLTAQQQKFAASAVAYAIEEKLSLDPTECHVVMDGKPSSSSMTAWVVAKTLMHHIQREADGLGGFEADERVDRAAGAGAHGERQGLVGLGVETDAGGQQGLLVSRMHAGLGREQKARAQLHRIGAQGQHGGDAGAIGHAATGDHRQAHRTQHRAHHHHGADFVRRRMAAGLAALSVWATRRRRAC